MSSIFVRDLDAKAVQRLKERARRNGRSLQGEAKLLIEQAAGSDDVRAVLDRWKRRFAGRKFSPSAADVIRRDRSSK